MIKSNQAKKEEILRRLEDLNKKGVKLTQKNLDVIDPNLYSTAKALYGNSWMNVKNAFYEHIEVTKNPQKNLQRLLVRKVENIEEESNIQFVLNNKINKNFIKFMEKNDPYLKDIILNTFVSWENFYKFYSELNAPEEPEFSEDELVKGLAMAITSDGIIQENVIAEKYTDIYNAIVREYGSLKSGFIHFLTEANASK